MVIINAFIVSRCVKLKFYNMKIFQSKIRNVLLSISFLKLYFLDYYMTFGDTSILMKSDQVEFWNVDYISIREKMERKISQCWLQRLALRTIMVHKGCLGHDKRPFFGSALVILKYQLINEQRKWNLYFP